MVWEFIFQFNMAINRHFIFLHSVAGLSIEEDNMKDLITNCDLIAQVLWIISKIQRKMQRNWKDPIKR